MSVAVLVMSVLGSSLCRAAQPVEGILVLRNGNLLRGRIQRHREQYLVQLPHGQLRVRASQVETCCTDIEDAFQHRRQLRGGASADSHLELAAWCLRHDLFEHAESELRHAQTTDPDHPRLALLRRQLKQSLQLAARDIQRRAAADAAAEPVAPLDPAALEKAPPWARVLFVRQIQPLVVGSCATSGCHQADSTEGFHLNRLAVDGAGHPEATQRNLAATLQQIDWQTAQQSVLLQRARQAHGSTSASTPLPAHKLQVLQGWIEQLAEAHRKENEIRLLPAVVQIAALPRGEQLILHPPQQATSDLRGSETLSPAPAGQVRQVNFEPVDPFDPTRFNCRYSTAKPAEPAEPTASESSVPHVLAPGEPALIPTASAE